MTELHWLRDGDDMFVSGELTERSDFKPLLAELKGITRLDLEGISRINSCGVREWIYFVRDAEKAGYKLTLVHCSVAFVQQLNMISNFAGKATIESVMAPFACASCKAEAAFEVDLTEDPFAQVRGARICPACEGTMEFDDLEESYFSFLEP
jgi:ABC-type transporter Mla MlaB component